ncbi:GH25 family lysozyme [Limosilactobacillus fastidiosus]|uniref:Lysozyme n=1 Tax=Limosilactobacillus fastidiosus TaxID=2759855 RepID=A0ABR6E8X5_9LACO|nr:GH25 family lysozyme [Limosilactobacillus fastidiosus]MBB1063645.1 hypothetical protein [Limosilactobacillus fastidiosus]MCD7084220.1 hypothetical protein [Limosilactobacillus fastidiosus]
MLTPNVIDISEQCSTIDFSKLKSEGIKSVIIRLGVGNTQDKRATEFITEAKRVGLIIHGYHEYQDDVENQIQWSIQNAHKLGLSNNAYYFLKVRSNKNNIKELFRPFYRNWKMNRWNVGLYASVTEFNNFNSDEFERNDIYKWAIKNDDQSIEKMNLLSINSLDGIGKDIDVSGKLNQVININDSIETDPNKDYRVSSGAFVGFDYSTTSIQGGKFLVASPDGVNKIPKLGPDGSFMFNRDDGERILKLIGAEFVPKIRINKNAPSKVPSDYSDGIFYEKVFLDSFQIKVNQGKLGILTTKVIVDANHCYARQQLEIVDSKKPVILLRNGRDNAWKSWTYLLGDEENAGSD